MIKKIKNKFAEAKHPPLLEDDLLHANVCPNCWGRQEWESKFLQYVEDQTKANINHDRQHQKAFILQFVETQVTGIRLKQQGESLVCSICKTTYDTKTSDKK